MCRATATYMKKIVLLFIFFATGLLNTFAQSASVADSLAQADASVFSNTLKTNAYLFQQYISLYKTDEVKPAANKKVEAKTAKRKQRNTLAFTKMLKANANDFIKHISFYPFEPVNPTLSIAANTDTIKPIVIASNDNTNIGLYIRLAVKNADTTKHPFISVTDEALQASLSKHISANFDELAATDTLKELRPKAPVKLNELKRQVSLVTNDTLKAAYYQKLADYYLVKYDSVTVKKTKQDYQNIAIEYTMKALHSYSRYNDSNGLRTSFDNLVRVYKDQRKFSQAKWFILQSNTISRQLNDAPNIIKSLVTLAGIKMSIKDYSLAKRDLDEALVLSTQNKFPKQESIVQVSFSTLYTYLKQPKNAAIALKRHDFIEDSIVKADEAQRIAAIKTQDSTQQAKKKLYTSVVKKSLKTNSPKKVVSL
jgi:hypothetical protein